MYFENYNNSIYLVCSSTSSLANKLVMCCPAYFIRTNVGMPAKNSPFIISSSYSIGITLRYPQEEDTVLSIELFVIFLSAIPSTNSFANNITFNS